MSNEKRGTGPEYRAQDASVAHAGPANKLPEPGEPEPRDEAAGRTPTAEQLDRREERFTRPRKPMGPTQGQAPETVPEEP
ncbi:hypothetical protein BN159_7439 [Streptomyces davaonensis JCM 4913]|uniref:Uncharacterized protein n=1 Tax=Streptomyces davaonensis (strain DSM 101723 / JCM 4913 / KCC S-0913 / 768) TaxID=1214101 RepID=K4RDQ2_STRDJ|nr:hypothetical protein BN159_7439 [Streptomyces davaonensis JCM 4913]